jgi:trehalose 6-phosphate phosphatase
MTLHARRSDLAEIDPALPLVLPEEPGWALFVDLDGTLCAYEDDPAAVALDDAQCELLRALALRVDDALCILSGRADADLQRALRGCAVARCGEHGRNANSPPDPGLEAELVAVEATMAALAAGFDGAGAWVERKPASCALHYRRAPQLALRLTHALRVAAERCTELRLIEGQCVLEMVGRHDSKGTALRRLMRDAPFAGRVPVAIGDDVTDEDAFVAATALGGFGVGVGVRASVAARHRLADSAACNAWLRVLALTPREVPHA